MVKLPEEALQSRESLAAAHTKENVRARIEKGPDESYLKDFIYGAIDGAVTTFAVVSGVAGAQLSSGIVIILGLANLIADGFSMAVSNYLGTKAELQEREDARLEELREIELFPEGEREEIRQIFVKKGFKGEQLNHAVETITSNTDRWVDMMLQEEHGFSSTPPDAFKAALATLVSFIVVGFIPLLTFVWNWLAPISIPTPFFWSSTLTAVAFFAVGAGKSKFVSQRWYIAGFETLLVGGSAAVLAYFIGVLLHGVVPDGAI